MLLQFSYGVASIVRNYYTKVATRYPKYRPQNNYVRKPKNPVINVNWTDQQLKVFDAIERRKSVFITGSAGTGKSKMIQEIIKVLRKIHGRKEVAVTAPTGVVACALGGQTLHSFAGVGLGQADANTLLSKVLGNKRVLKRWKLVKALVLDEISMVEGELFDKLEYIARMTRESDEPWGGIQIIVGGDFLQLPPVIVGKKKCCSSSSSKEFAFEADSWDESFQMQVSLNTVFRQSDPELIRVLQGVRRGELDAEGLELLEKHRCIDEPDETVSRLFPRIADVNRVNDMRLKGLGEEIVDYEAFDKGEEPWVDRLNSLIAPNQLQLCKGARVMLIKNLNVRDKLVNGAVGTIIGFEKASKGNIAKICHGKLLPVVKFDSGCEKVIKPKTFDVMVGDMRAATRLQLPLNLAWAMSIHKSQGMTVDRLHTNLSKAFGFGMIYVALSRLRSLDGLSFSSDTDLSKIKAHPKVLEYYKTHFE